MNDVLDLAKIELLNSLLDVYKSEIEVIYAIGISWEQLNEEAKAKCAEDFDEAIIARETLLEELAELRDIGIIPDEFEFAVFAVDQHLLEQNIIVKEIYGLDVHAFLNIKQPKALKSAG